MPQELESLVLTIKQAATALQVSEGTIWNLFSSGQVPYVRFVALVEFGSMISSVLPSTGHGCEQ